MMRLLPRSLMAQVALLSIGALLLAQIVGFWLFTVERSAAIRTAQRIETVERATRLAQLLGTAPDVLRAILITAATSRAVQFDLSSDPRVAEGDIDLAVDWPGIRAQEVASTPHDRGLPPPGMRWLHDQMRTSGFAPAELQVSLPLATGGWLNATARFERPGVQLPPQVFGSTVLTLVLLWGALWIGLRRITGPLKQLAAAADGFGLDSDPPPMPSGGPREVRALLNALARMHARLSQFIEERTRMLAALGHDLRSPITALRVRAEMVEDNETRERMILTLDEMQEMTEATLAFARGVSVAAPIEQVDLAALLAELSTDLSFANAPITVIASSPLVLPLHRVAIRRALRNLLENAQRYGGAATIKLELGDGVATIAIDDTGAGIPEADLERVFDPFERLDSSRSRETGGTGLGLPIARSILRAHEGEVLLSNRPEGGLRVLVQLPIPAK